FMMLACSGMIASTYSLVAVPLEDAFDTSRMEVMLSMTVYSAAGALLMPFVGSLMDRFSVRALMLLGALLLSSGYGAISIATSMNQVLVIFALLIAPANVLLGPLAATVLLARWFDSKRGRAIGFAIAGIAAGGFFFPMIIQGLLEAFAWREALRWLGLIIALITVPAALLAVNSPEERGLHPDGAAEASAAAREEMARTPVTTRDLLADPAFWMIAATVAIVTSGMKGMITNLAPLAIDAGVAASKAAMLISVYAGCGFIAKLVFAALSDRLGPRILMFAALGGFGAGMALMTQAQLGFGAIALGVAIIGLFGGMMVPIESFLAPRVFGKRAVGKAMGLLSGTILITLLSTPPLFGLIFDITGSYKGIFWVFSGLAVTALLWLPLIRLHPRDDPLAQAEPAPAQ
ncbi:MAG: MFS transporter, partial [Novosphingobium sp.]|nr:MFS transporter [Novosphingobium sp.]